MKLWPKIKNEGWLEDILLESRSVRYWADIFQQTYENKINTWDYCWTLSCWVQSGLSIIPSANLVSNIGFGDDATHTKGKSRFANIPVVSMSFPLDHPPFVIRNTKADEFVQKYHFHKPNIFRKLLQKGKNTLAKFLKQNESIQTLN